VTSIVFPAGVTAIGDKTPYRFGALESVVFPAGCTVFGSWPFAYCKSLKAVSLPAGSLSTFVRFPSIACASQPATKGCLAASGSCKFPAFLPQVVDDGALFGRKGSLRTIRSRRHSPRNRTPSKIESPLDWRREAG
jgi:hypothetical protein